MPIYIVQLGSPRLDGEGLRLGTVRRPPRGVAKQDFARLNYYDLWLPVLAPSPETIKLSQQASSDGEWGKFIKKYRSEMSKPEPQMMLNLLAALSNQTNFSVGCYCDDEARCHRSELRSCYRNTGVASQLNDIIQAMTVAVHLPPSLHL